MNDKKGKNIEKYCGKNATLKIKLLSLFGIVIFSIFSLNEVFAMDSIKKELYTKYSFKRMPNFVVPRSFGATATVLQDGNVLFTGGFVSRLNSTNSTEVYSPIKNKFLKLPNMNEEMYNHKMYLLPNNNVVVIEEPNKIELFDVKTNTFKKIKGISYDNILTSYEFIELNQNTVLMYPYDYQNGKTPIVLMNLNNLSLKK